MNNENNASQNYNADAVRALEGIELIRARPTLFLDGLDADGLHRLLFEAIDNSIDEYRAGFGGEVVVRVRADGSVEIEDSGRGMPTELHTESGIPTPVFLMTKAFAGAKFEQGAYSFSGGLHGVGLKCINAFSEWVELVCLRDGVAETFRFNDGIFSGSSKETSERSGTIIRFLPRYDIFGAGGFDHDRICTRLEDVSYLNPGIRCRLESDGENLEFFSENGVEGLLEASGCTDMFVAKVSEGDLQMDCCVGTLPHGGNMVVSYANGIPTSEGGSHVTGVKNGIARTISSYAARRGLVKDSDPAIGAGDVAEGALLVVAVRMDTPPFSSQKKTKIVSQELEIEISNLVSSSFGEWLEASPARAKHVVSRMLQAARNREKLKALKAKLRLVSQARRLKKPSSVLSSSSNCEELLVVVKDPLWRDLASEETDLLPMRLAQSPPTNRTSLEKILKNPDYFALAAVIGGGVGSPEDDPEGGFALSKIRYKKITVRVGRGAAAGVAGSFVLMFMERYLPGLIESEKVFWKTPDINEEVRVSSSQSLKEEVAGATAEDHEDAPEEQGDPDPQGEGGGEDPD
jgi:DNA gyrase subunit B